MVYRSHKAITVLTGLFLPLDHQNIIVPFVHYHLNSTHTAMADVLLFQNYLFQKRVGPPFIPEGRQAVYSVRLDGPPPNDVAITLSAADDFIRFYTSVYW